MQTEICELKENLDSVVASNKIEVRFNSYFVWGSSDWFLDNRQNSWVSICVCLQVEVLQEELTYATEEVERLSKVFDEQSSLLQASQKQTAQKDDVIQNLQWKVTLFLSTQHRENK